MTSLCRRKPTHPCTNSPSLPTARVTVSRKFVASGCGGECLSSWGSRLNDKAVAAVFLPALFGMFSTHGKFLSIADRRESPSHDTQSDQVILTVRAIAPAWLNAGHLAEGRMENGECFPLRLLSFLVYQVNEFFAEALVSTRKLEDLAVAFLGQSFFRKRPLHL